MTDEMQKLVDEVAENQAAIDGQSTDTRTRVLTMGRRLRRLQKLQKKEQAETGKNWYEWCDEQKGGWASFPHWADARKYMRISQYPDAYEVGMSIKEAYKQACLWHKNGGKKPTTKKTIKARPLITIGAAAGKLEHKIEKLCEQEFSELATEQEWTEDEILGATDSLTILRQTCNLMIRRLRELHEQYT